MNPNNPKRSTLTTLITPNHSHNLLIPNHPNHSNNPKHSMTPAGYQVQRAYVCLARDA